MTKTERVFTHLVPMGRNAVMCAFAAMLLVLAGALGPVGAAQAQVPPARALFLDLETVFQQSAVGGNIRQQLETMLAEVKQRADATEKGFEQREATLLTSLQNRPQDEVRRDLEALRTERTGAMHLFTLERAAIQAAASEARRKVSEVLKEIMRDIAIERGANMILDVKAVHVGGVDYDITAEVIARLDKRLPKLKVERPKANQ